MRKAIVTALALCSLLLGEELALGEPVGIKSTHRSSPSQALQIHSSKTLDSALKSLKNVPIFHKQYVGIYQSGNYYATCYCNPAYSKIPKWVINDFKKAQFNTPYIVYPDPDNKPLGNDIKVDQPAKATKLTMESLPPKLSPHERTHLMVEGQKAYIQQDYTQATIFYEIMERFYAGRAFDRFGHYWTFNWWGA